MITFFISINLNNCQIPLEIAVFSVYDYKLFNYLEARMITLFEKGGCESIAPSNIYYTDLILAFPE